MSPPHDEISKALRQEFLPHEVKVKPGSVSGGQALAIWYVGAHQVMDRLDDVLGIDNWSDQYEFHPDGTVVCRLSIRVGGQWITKIDVGCPSKQPDKGDAGKAAVTSAFKRAAVKFGVARYLDSLPRQWLDFNEQKKRWVKQPVVPSLSVLAGQKQKKEEQKKEEQKKEPATAAATRPDNGTKANRPLPNFEETLAGIKASRSQAQLLERRDWFVRQTYFTNEQAKAIRAAADSLFESLPPTHETEDIRF